MEAPLPPSLPQKAIHHFIEEQARQNPDLPALAFKSDILTYSSINRQSNKLAYYLMALGVTAESLVGISVNRSLEMVIAILAVWKAGGAYVPIDPGYPAHRIEYILEDSSISLLLTQQSLLPYLLANIIKKIILDNEHLAFASYPETNPCCLLAPNNLAYLLYTSGSTGNPKGVMVEHHHLIATYLSWQSVYELTNKDCHLQMASFSFDVFAGDLLRALCSGGKLVICPKSFLLRPDKLYDLMLTHAVNCAEFVPTILRRLVGYVKRKSKSLSFMRLLVCGSDRWTLGEYRDLKQFCGEQTRVINSYGLTEASIDSSWFEENLEASELSLNQYVPIGKPFPHVSLLIMNEQGDSLPVGVVGEILIGGAGVARGYYNKPQLTNERFIIQSLNGQPPRKFYKTGDQGCFLSDGNIQFLGRDDNQIKLRGIRVELSEIECTINTFPGIKESVVLLSEQEPSHPRLVAYLVFRQKEKKLLSELRHYLINSLPNYLIPAALIPLACLPVTPNGKIDRENLKKRRVIFHH